MKSQRGFSLLELIVAMGILVAVVAAILTSLSQAFQANQGVTLMADMQQNLRAGMNYMTRDIIQTGEGIPTGGIPIPYGSGLLAINRPSPIGARYTFPSTYTTIPAVTPGPALGPTVLRPTDIITIIYADNTYPMGQYPVACPSTNPSCTKVCNGSLTVSSGTLSIKFDTSCVNLTNETIPVKTGDLIMLTNSQGSVLQTVTAISIPSNTLTFAPGDAFNLNGNDNPKGSPQGTLGTIESPQFSGTFPTTLPTTATRIWMYTYFISNSDPVRPMLMRQLNMNAPQIAAEVIEDLQITYDIVDGSTNPTNIDQPVSPDTPAQIRKVNLFIAGRSEYVFTPSNAYFRNNLITQISLRSLAFVQQYH